MITVICLLIPFLGTTLGAACVYLLKGEAIHEKIQKALLGFASGVMVAASVWSLLIPAMESSASLGKLAFLPAMVGFLVGMFFLLLIDMIVPHLHLGDDHPEGIHAKLKKTTMMVFAVTLHNIPEGMAVGITVAAALSGELNITISSALALSLGIAIQNFPEGAIVSLPLKMESGSKHKSFLYGTLSGAVEPVAAGLTLLLTSVIAGLLPYFLSFAAGAMLYVVVEELIPEASEGEHSNVSTIGFALGFALMMMLDVALG